AKWTPVEVTALVNYLHEHRAECGEAGNFKEITYNAAATAVGHLYNGGGGVKTGKMVATKWAALKAIYNAIEVYRNRSGVHWDNERGADIQGADAAQVWKDHVVQKGNAAIKPFRNGGWEHYEKIHDIFPS
ncbi:hypothetical protein BU15DRAFT_34672, partial [Melanogaster broomeanus]